MTAQPRDEHASYGVYDAKTQFASIVDRAFHGEIITITKHGRPIAQVTPVKKYKMPVEEFMALCEASSKSLGVKGPINYRELIGRDDH